LPPGVRAPTEEVAETPVMSKAKSKASVGEPTLEVALNPVKPITSAGAIVPNADVAETPVTEISAST
jgi:hypothetical protein